MCKEKRIAYEETVFHCRIEQAEVRPWELFTGMKPINPAPVPMKKWEKHFIGLLNPEGVPPFYTSRLTSVEESHHKAWYNIEFMDEEVKQVIQRMKNYKATGLNRITNEHLKASIPVFLHLWTSLFNSC